jgi:gas vesicle protein
MGNNCQYGASTGAFLAGALVGAGIALLLAPQSGTESRKMLRDYVGQAKDELIERGREAKATFETAKEHGREAFEFAKERGKNMYETAKETAKDSSEGLRNRV